MCVTQWWCEDGTGEQEMDSRGFHLKEENVMETRRW